MTGTMMGERRGKRGPIPKEPTKRIAKLLGKRPDAEIAKLAGGIGRGTVARWRIARGIRPSNRPWTPEEREETKRKLKLLHGTPGVSLKTAADALGITYNVAYELSVSMRPKLRWKRTGRPEREETATRARAAYGMRQANPPLTFKEIGKVLHCTPQEADRLARRGKVLQRPAA